MQARISIEEIMERLGGRPAAAKALSVSQQAIQKWWNKGLVPANRVLEVERLTGISRSRIRPDFYPSVDKDGDGDPGRHAQGEKTVNEETAA